MSQTIPYVRDLREAAATIAAQHIAAGYPSDCTSVRLRAIEAGLDAAAPFLMDAAAIEQASESLPEGCDPHRHLQLLNRQGKLRLSTFRLEDGASAS